MVEEKIVARRKTIPDFNPERLLVDGSRHEERDHVFGMLNEAPGLSNVAVMVEAGADVAFFEEAALLPPASVDAPWGDPVLEDGDDDRDEPPGDHKRSRASGDAGIDSADISDDPVRMYLGEIGRVPLLPFNDERVLARRLDSSNHLAALEQVLTEREGRSPQAWEIAVALVRRLAATPQLFAALAEDIGFSHDLTLSRVADHPGLRAAIDAVLDPDMMARLNVIQVEDAATTRGKVIALSLDSLLLPAEAVEVLSEYTLSRLDEALRQPGVHAELQALDPLFITKFQRVRAEGL